MSAVVYWIHHPNHTDMFTQGYIGVSKNTKKRWLDHHKRTGNAHLLHAIKKYGWDNLIKEVLLMADKAYCLLMETKIRPEDKIGWNITKGGGMPPHINVWNKGRKMSKEELDSLKAKGFGFDKGSIPWNKGIKYTEEMKSKIYDIGSYTKGKPAYNKGIPLKKELIEKLHKEQECIYCHRIFKLGNLARYHNDKCKLKGLRI